MFSLPLKVTDLMREFEPDWFVAGGWAIDLFLEKETRRHEDIEIVVFRRDQLALQNHLGDWILRKAAKGVLTSWKSGEFLEPPVHEIHCQKLSGELRQLEVLLNEADGKDWFFRRNQRITKPISELHLTTVSGIKSLCPEVVLLYKSKNPRAKDEQDFKAAVKYLNPEAKRWLRDALSICRPEHHWLSNL